MKILMNSTHKRPVLPNANECAVWHVTFDGNLFLASSLTALNK